MRIPNNQLVQPEIHEDEDGIQFYNISARGIAIDSLQGGNSDDLPKLGQTFLTSAYLFVEPDEDRFTIWQANPTSDQDIIPQIGEGSSLCSSAVASATAVRQPPTPTSFGVDPRVVSNKSSNTGAIVGGVVGGVAAITILVAFAVFLLRRRRSRSAPENVPLAPMTSNKRGEYHASGGDGSSPNDSIGGRRHDARGVSELYETADTRPELGGNGIRPELGLDDARIEVAANERNDEPGKRYELQ